MTATHQNQLNWERVPIKGIADYFVSNVDKHTKKGELPVRLCNYSDVYHNERITTEMNLMRATATEDEINKFRLKCGDVVITKDSESWEDIAVAALIDDEADDFICGYHLAIIRPHTGKLDGRFLFRAIQSREVAQQFELASTGVTRYGLPKGAIGSAKLPMPSIKTQCLIADYLDREVASIDELIEQKQAMLRLIAEQQAALICKYVTRGLDDHIPLKSTDFDWLGDVPEHWLIERAKHLFTVRDERSEAGLEELLTVSHITGVTSRAEKNVHMFQADDKAGYKLVEKGDFVTNTLWAWMGAMGISPLDGLVSPAYHVYTSKGLISPEFMELLCRAKPFIAEVTRWSKGVWSSRLRLYPEGLFEIHFPVPPLDEQRAIVAAIDADKQKTAELAEALKKSITLLQERRSALITAAVTGQIPEEEMSA